MAVGYLFRDQCFVSNAVAADAFFLAKESSYTAGTTSYLSWFEKSGAVWQIKRQSISSTGVITNLTSSTATVPTFPTCDTTVNFTDGVTVGWGIATAMVMAWGFSMIRKQAR